MARYEHSGSAGDARLVGDFAASATSLNIDVATGWPTGATYKAWLAVEPDTVNEEHFLMNARTGTAISLASAADRGLEGTTNQFHGSGSIVRHIWSATEADDIRVAKGVSVSISSAVVTLTSGVVGIINFDTEAFDTDTYHSTVSNATRLTVPASLPGKYRVWGIAEFGSSATGHRAMDVRVNGSTVYAIASAAGFASDAVPTLSGSVTLALVAGDYVEMRLFQDSGGSLTFNANGMTRFGMDMIGF